MTTNNTLNIGRGNFDYVSDIWDREIYENAWQAISLTNMWDFVKQDIESFMFSLDPRLDIISEKMAEIGYNVHSSASFGRVMRQMQFLAKFGEDKFKECFNLDGQINDHDFNTITNKNEDKLLDYMGGY
jgi:hypothetical protein